MKELDRVNYFGVRHLSPGAAWHLIEFLEEKSPSLVLIEGFSDANETISYLSDEKLKPPAALLAYSKKAPVRTLVYPLSSYSPEYQAMVWAKKNEVCCKFIDLSSEMFLGMTEKQYSGGKESAYIDIYSEIAANAGEDSFDSYWERSFEHITHKNSFQTGVHEMGATMRLLEENDRDFFRAENLVREAYMRKLILDEIHAGTDPEKIVVIAGAYHVPSFTSSEYVMSEEECKRLPRVESSITIMPYSYYKLSRQSGYGAGNHAPMYFQMIWQLLQTGNLEQLSTEYLTKLGQKMSQSGHSVSSAHIIEAVRLAESLAGLKEGWYPVLEDLKDAAATVFAAGNHSKLSKFMYELEVGNELGYVPENKLQTSIQADFERQIKKLSLERYRKNSSQTLKLDLRENTNSKSQKSAFLGLSRSRFFYRLSLLDIPFAVQEGNDSREWIENWTLNWRPESEIALVESVLFGETVELAASAKLIEQIQKCESVNLAANLVQTACNCGLTKELKLSQSLLQRLSSESLDLKELSQTCLTLSELIRFGSVRNVNTADFEPLLEELFNEACFQIPGNSSCTNENVKELIDSLVNLQMVINDVPEKIDRGIFIKEIKTLAQKDLFNPILSGYAVAVLLELKLISDNDFGNEVCRRISPGIEADSGAGWFEGLARRNHTYLIRNKELWKQLNQYIKSLDEEQFKKALIYLRRTFADFSKSEIKEIAAQVAELLNGLKESAPKLANLQLSEDELSILDDLDL